MSILVPKPTWSTGFARGPAESERPDRWDGLVGAWMPTFGPTGLSLQDVSGNANHGVLTNMDPATDWVGTEKGWGLDFNKLSFQNVDFGQFDFRNLPELTIVCWANYDSSGSAEHVLVANWTVNTAATIIRLEPSNDTVELFAHTQAGTKTAVSAAFPVGVWNQFCLVFDQASLRCYINGLISGTPTATESPMHGTISPVNLWAGGDPFGGGRDFLNGQIAQVLIYNRALSASEIQDLYVDPEILFRRATAFPFPLPSVAVTPLGAWHGEPWASAYHKGAWR